MGPHVRALCNSEEVPALLRGHAATCVGSFHAQPHATGACALQVGHGARAFDKAKRFLESWGHFQLGWASVDPRTPVVQGAPVAVTSKTLFMWSCNPLKVV